MGCFIYVKYSILITIIILKGNYKQIIFLAAGTRPELSSPPFRGISSQQVGEITFLAPSLYDIFKCFLQRSTAPTELT